MPSRPRGAHGTLAGMPACRQRRRPRPLTLGLVAVLLVTGCTRGALDDGEPAARRDPDLTLSFTQLLPDEGTERGLLRVVNQAADPLHVTGIGLDWSGYGPAFAEAKDVTILPGRTMDLRLTLPAPRCGTQPILRWARWSPTDP